MKLFTTIVLFFPLFFTSCEEVALQSEAVDGSEVPLGRRLIEILPLAEENEFGSAEAGARGFVQGLVDDDWDQILRATSLRLICERMTFEARTEELGVWDVGSMGGDPSSPMAAFAGHAGAVRQFLILQQTLLGEKKAGVMHRIKDPSDASEVAAAKKRALYLKPEDLRISGVQLDLEMTERMSKGTNFESPMRKVLGVVDVAYVTVDIEGVPNVGKARIECFMEKIDTNWLVRSAAAVKLPNEAFQK
ncbi:MAG: hypothetical protein ACSHX6_01820 [Akkermansiaceae bacterium]